MRKILTGILLLCLCGSLCACGSSHKTDVTDNPDMSIRESTLQPEIISEDTDDSDAEPSEDTRRQEDAAFAETAESMEVEDQALTSEENSSKDNVEDKSMQLTIGDQAVSVEWEDNESIAALMELCADSPLTIQMSMYGGFEQVGSIGTSLPRDDKQTTTSAGDIVLYSGNQIVVFYGSNSWSYTRLGRITGLSDAELTELLGNGDVSITISNQ